MKHEPIPPIHMQKQLGGTCKLSGTESLGVFRVGHTVLARLMESQIWHQPVGSVALGGRVQKRDTGLYLPFSLGKGCPPALTSMSDTLVSPCILLVPFKLLH